MSHRITPFLIALPLVFAMGSLALGERAPGPSPDAAPEAILPEAAAPEEGPGLMERGARMLMQGLLEEVGPQLGEMRDGMGEAMREAGPAIRDFLAMIDDLRNYDAPVMLPNGDILLPRRAGAPPPPTPHAPALPEETGPDGEIEL
ncbi:hypothetical protein [Phaeovulum sp. W22_SRMD_FR3]|uniref:hypothetical protein n=1 Tax=Phaeovulum sp. W22_SRMD_FR3 TaxID=3240274 RepID=UPI003F95E89E